MKRLAEFPLDGGGSVVVEVDDHDSAGPLTRGWRDHDGPAQQAQQSFQQAIGRVQPAARAVLAQFREMADAPDEVVVELGLQLSIEAGSFIAAASSSANFKVALTWRGVPPPVGAGSSSAEPRHLSG
jgi:hypothetical protein